MRYAMRLFTGAAAPLVLIGLLVGFQSPVAQAQNNPLVTVDEFGNGNLVTLAGGVFVLPSAIKADPGPGGLPATLQYDLPFLRFNSGRLWYRLRKPAADHSE